MTTLYFHGLTLDERNTIAGIAGQLDPTLKDTFDVGQPPYRMWNVDLRFTNSADVAEFTAILKERLPGVKWVQA